jgi:hypothetical protein
LLSKSGFPIFDRVFSAFDPEIVVLAKICGLGHNVKIVFFCGKAVLGSLEGSGVFREICVGSGGAGPGRVVGVVGVGGWGVGFSEEILGFQCPRVAGGWGWDCRLGNEERIIVLEVLVVRAVDVFVESEIEVGLA